MAALGRLHLLSSDSTPEQSFPLLKSTLTFGRLQTCDVRIQLPSVSKLHAELRIDSITRTAELHVHSVNGVRSGTNVWRANEVGVLDCDDQFTIAGRTFQLEIGHVDLVKEVESPAKTAPLRYSLVAAAEVDTPSKPAPPAPRRSWVASLVSPFGFSSAAPTPSISAHAGDLISLDDSEPEPSPAVTEQPSTYQSDLQRFFDGDEDDPLNAPDIEPVPLLPGTNTPVFSYDAAPPQDDEESSDEEIENLLVSPRSSPAAAVSDLTARRSHSAPSLADSQDSMVPLNDNSLSPPSSPNSGLALLPTPTRLPNGVSRRHSLREKVLIRSAVKTHVMARSHSTGHIPQVRPQTSPTPAPRRSSLPNNAAPPPASKGEFTLAAEPSVMAPASHFEEEDDSQDEDDDDDDDDEEVAEVVEVHRVEVVSRTPSPEPQQLSPRALRAARRSSSLEPPLPSAEVDEDALDVPESETTDAPVHQQEYDSSSDSDSSPDTSYVDREVPLAGEPPCTPRTQLKPRKSALKTPPPPGSESPDITPPSSATRSLKRKVSWSEKLNNYREIPHRDDLPEVKRARLEAEQAAVERAAALASPPVTRRTSLIFVHEHPELEVAKAPATPKRSVPPTTPRTPHSAGRAQRGAPAASVQRAFDSSGAPSITTGTPRKTPLRKPGRSVSPVKRDAAAVVVPNFVPTNLEPVQSRLDLAQLLASPVPRLGSFSPMKPSAVMPVTPTGAPSASTVETPRTVPTAQSLLARLESMRKPAASSSFPPVSVDAPSPIKQEPEADLLYSSPSPAIAEAPAPMAATPNLTGLRQLFKPAPPPAETPRFGGVRQLFHMPSISVFSPRLDGVKELLQLPSSPAKIATPTIVIPELAAMAKPIAKQEEAKPATVRTPLETKAEPARSALPVRAGRVRAPSVEPVATSSVPKRVVRKAVPTVIAADLPEPSAPFPAARSMAPVSSSSSTSSRSTRSRSNSLVQPATNSRVKAKEGEGATTRLPSRAKATGKARVADKENTSPVEPASATMASKTEVATTRSGRVLRSRKL